MGVRRMEFWPRQLMRRLLRSSNGVEELSSDETCSTDFDNGGAYTPKDVPAMLVRGISETLFSEHIDIEEFRVAVGTWNVAGRSPRIDLDLEDWLGISEPADIYVLGFQEIVPLNPGNVLGAEQDGTAHKWESLIRRSLNKCLSHRRSVSLSFDPQESNKNIDNDIALQNGQNGNVMPVKQKQVTVKSKHRRKKNSVDISKVEGWVTLSSDDEALESFDGHGRYVRLVSKQMVGIFITVWARREIKNSIRNLKVSCVGCGLMGYLGNKGAISVSMSVHETSFCFVCTHLTSGEREGDELKRNADVTEILRRTYFHRPKFTWPEMPETIMGHDRIIWFGDLNYRITWADSQTRLLISKRDWQTLLKKDQLRIEKMPGHVFDGWQEGPIDFAPTYKYVLDSDRYSGDCLKAGEKRRTPAWCDRILWSGKGLKQLQYARAESRFSDHRPVRAVFLADVEVFEDSKLKRMWTFSKTHEKAKELLTFKSETNEPKDQFDEVAALPVPVIAVC